MKFFLIQFTIMLILIIVIVGCKDTEEHVISVELNSSLFLVVGKTEKLMAVIKPYSATNRDVSWTSSKPDIATVSTNGIVTAKTPGTTIITVTTKDGNYKAACTVKVFALESIVPEMVWVEGKTFIMGNNSFYYDEKPAHEVTLSDFYMAKYLVTQEVWNCIMDYNPSHNKGDNLPVENVSWDNVHEFIKKLNEMTSKNYRLPTEAEWEYAARGGDKSIGYMYSGSNKIDDIAWYAGNSNGTSHPVGLKNPNELGIYDMSGNLWEWCRDYYAPYSDIPQTNPIITQGVYCILRGCCFINENTLDFRISLRGSAPPNSISPYRGFRLVHP